MSQIRAKMLANIKTDTLQKKSSSSTATSTSAIAPPKDQFRSTQRWNEMKETFFMSLPLKRHWRNFRTYSDCFSASEAIEWLFRTLKADPNFSHTSLSRQKATNVLAIFLRD